MSPGENIYFFLIGVAVVAVILFAWLVFRKRKKWAVALTALLIIGYVGYYVSYPAIKAHTHAARYEQVTEYLATYNLEKLVSSIHKLTITPKNDINSETLSVSLKIGDEIVGYYDEENGEEETHKFPAELNEEGVYTVTQGNFLHFNEDEVFWGEDVTVLIEHNGETEEIKLGSM